MNYSEFVTKYTGQLVDVDWAFWAECIDLMKRYCMDVYWMPNKKAGNANEAWKNKYWYFDNSWKYIEWKSPQQGDIVFINTASEYDHVGICHKNNSLTVQVFDQIGNGNPVGGEKPASLRLYQKKDILGYWRYNKLSEQEKIVNDFADLHNIQGRSKTKWFSQFDTLYLLATIKCKSK